MWYEILPTLGIIGVCLWLPHVINYRLHKAVFGIAEPRSVSDPWDRAMIMRDLRVSGANIAVMSKSNLNCIPDN